MPSSPSSPPALVAIAVEADAGSDADDEPGAGFDERAGECAGEWAVATPAAPAVGESMLRIRAWCDEDTRSVVAHFSLGRDDGAPSAAPGGDGATAPPASNGPWLVRREGGDVVCYI